MGEEGRRVYVWVNEGEGVHVRVGERGGGCMCE